MTSSPPSARSLVIAAAVIAGMQKKDWTGLTFAEVMDWSNSKLSRLTTGARNMSEQSIVMALTRLDITGTQRDELFEFAANLEQVSWCHEHGQLLPDRESALQVIEAAALSVTSFGASLLPPLLQTADYTRMLVQGWQISDVDKRVAERHAQARTALARSKETFRFFIDEHTIGRRDLPAKIVCGQVFHLLRLAMLSGMSIRIVPKPTTGPRPYTSFALYTFPKHRPLIHIDQPFVSTYLEHSNTVAGFHHIVRDLECSALTVAETQDWLREFAATLLRTHDYDDPEWARFAAEMEKS